MKQILHKKNAFTLIELLIVIGVLATLATVSILVINPAQMIAQSRDARRLTELQSLNSALSLAEINNLSLGVGNTVYVSLPHTSQDCFGLGLPSLPVGWLYHCASSVDYKKVDGNGWVPVNFSLISSGPPLSVLPVDPVNAASSGNYYTYVMGGSYKLTSMFESAKYASKMNKDGGPDAGLYESGSNLNLANFQRGLVGYWKMDEQSGATVGDTSGNNNAGTLTNGPTWASGKVGGALNFDGVNDYASVPITLYGLNAFTIGEWVYPYYPKANASWTKYSMIGDFWTDNYTRPVMDIETDNLVNYTYMSVRFRARAFDGTAVGYSYNIFPWRNQWIHIARRFSLTDRIYKLYINGEEKQSASIPSNATTILEWNPDSYTNSALYKRFVFGASINYGEQMNLIEDDARIYNRALSAAEISAIYNATK